MNRREPRIICVGPDRKMTGDTVRPNQGSREKEVCEKNIPTESRLAEQDQNLKAQAGYEQSLTGARTQTVEKTARVKPSLAPGLVKPFHEEAKRDGKQQDAQRPGVNDDRPVPKSAVEGKYCSGEITGDDAQGG